MVVVELDGSRRMVILIDEGEGSGQQDPLKTKRPSNHNLVISLAQAGRMQYGGNIDLFRGHQ